MKSIPVIGAGLAGSEAAWQLAEAGQKVNLFEMRPKITTPVHKTEHCAELVCSNSLGSKLADRAGGVLQQELMTLNCHLLKIAQIHEVPAGQALAVNREAFAAKITEQLEKHPKIQLIREEATSIPSSPCIIATGPLTSPSLEKKIQELAGQEHLAFFDAIAPVITRESIDEEIVFLASRHEKGLGDYLNIPLNKTEYKDFIDNILKAERHPLKDFEIRC